MTPVRGMRAMLNQPGHESTGSIVAELVLGKYGPDITFALSDCSRVVTLSFGNCLEDSDDFENAMYKLDTIANATRALQKALRAEYRKRNG
jgi:hypothetical protein